MVQKMSGEKSDLFWLTEVQMARLEPYFPKSYGKPRVDGRRVLSGIIFIKRNGLRWRRYYNEERPHSAIGNIPPAMLANSHGDTSPPC
tara:strand:+ start:4770 stop:5033 length:264 start_codon:yes stop_codon:yes gene_type:complete